jgi:hypothetical protein
VIDDVLLTIYCGIPPTSGAKATGLPPLPDPELLSSAGSVQLCDCPADAVVTGAGTAANVVTGNGGSPVAFAPLVGGIPQYIVNNTSSITQNSTENNTTTNNTTNISDSYNDHSYNEDSFNKTKNTTNTTSSVNTESTVNTTTNTTTNTTVTENSNNTTNTDNSTNTTTDNDVRVVDSNTVGIVNGDVVVSLPILP